jgi:hypothetical protein
MFAGHSMLCPYEGDGKCKGCRTEVRRYMGKGKYKSKAPP